MDKDYFTTYEKVVDFMVRQRVSCPETIHQCDWVIENAYGFLTDLFECVKHDPRMKSVIGNENE